MKTTDERARENRARLPRRTTLIGLALTALGAGAVPAGASPGHRVPEVIAGQAPTLHPQGVAWDQRRRAFLVGSVRQGTVSVVTADGTVRRLASHERMVSTTGVHVDRWRGRLLVAHADVGLGQRTSPDTLLSRSGLAILDLATGRLEHLVNLVETPAPRVATEIAMDGRGNAYVTDSAAGAIYRVDPRGRASLLLQDPKFTAPVVGIAGIVWHPAGYLLAVNTGTGALFRIPPHDPSRVAEVALDQPLTGADGMTLRPDETLVVVANTLAGTGTNTVSLVRGTPGWASARTVSAVPWPDRDPTTVTLTPHGPYVLAGRLRELATGQPAGPFLLRRWETP